jgi:hypothetical protein
MSVLSNGLPVVSSGGSNHVAAELKYACFINVFVSIH